MVLRTALHMLYLLYVAVEGSPGIRESGCAVLGSIYASPGSLLALKPHCLRVTCLGIHADLQPLPACTCQTEGNSSSPWPDLSLADVKRWRRKGQLLYDERDRKTRAMSSISYGGDRSKDTYELPTTPHLMPPSPRDPWDRPDPEAGLWMNISRARSEGRIRGVPAVAAEVDLSPDLDGGQKFLTSSVSQQNRSSYPELELRPFIPLMKMPGSPSSMKMAGVEGDEILSASEIWKGSATRRRRSPRNVQGRRIHPQYPYYEEPVGKALCEDEWSRDRMNLVGVLSSHCLAIMCDRHSGLLLLTALSQCNCTDTAQDNSPDVSGEFQVVVRNEETQSNRSVRFLPAVVNQSSVSPAAQRQPTPTSSPSITASHEIVSRTSKTATLPNTNPPNTLHPSTPSGDVAVSGSLSEIETTSVASTKSPSSTSDELRLGKDEISERTAHQFANMPATLCASKNQKATEGSSSTATTIVSSPWRSILNPGNHNTYFGAPSYEAKYLSRKMSSSSGQV